MTWVLLLIILSYLAMFTFIYVNLSGITPFRPVATSSIFVSVIIPVRNESGNLPGLLENISLQDYPAESFEVIVVDDNSTDKTFEIAAGYSGINNFKVLINKGSGKKSALLTGAENAFGTLIITTDADCRMGNSWISTVASFYNLYHPDLIICPVLPESMKGFFGRFQELEFLSLQGVTAGTAMARQPAMCNGANLAFPAGTYFQNAVSLKPLTASGDDMFLLQSLKKKKNPVIMWLESKESMVVTKGKPTLCEYLRQRSRWISKAGKYDDPFVIILGIVTFVTILMQLFLTAASFFRPSFLTFLGAFLVLKSVPDFLILRNTALRYGKKHLMKWFIPSEVIYPFYVIAVLVQALFSGKRDWF